jgi:hypothetical protein
MRPGATAGRVVLTNTQSVSLSGLALTPRSRPAQLRVVRSRRIRIVRLAVEGTPRLAANVSVASSSSVRVARSAFARCGDGRPPRAGYCVLLRANRGVTIVGSRFRDCFGCDFVHGYANASVAIRLSTFERALVSPCGRSFRCPHQDLVHFIEGRNLVIEANRFGLYEVGAAQVYLTGGVRRVVVRNNVFLPTDPQVPGVVAKVGLLVGNPVADDVPRRVVIQHNTILSGARRWLREERGPTETSVYLSPVYRRLPARERPVLANNVLAVVATPARLCPRLRRSVRNVIARGVPCSATDAVADPALDAHGRRGRSRRRGHERRVARYRRLGR